MNYRLLVAIEVIDFLETLSKPQQRKIRLQFLAINQSPDRFSDFQEFDGKGRAVEINLFHEFAIKYWIDIADRQVKILDLHWADR